MFRKIILSQFAVPFMVLFLALGGLGFIGMIRGLDNLVSGETVSFKGVSQRALVHRNPGWVTIYEPQQPSTTHFIAEGDKGRIWVQTRKYNNDYLRFGLVRVEPFRPANDSEIQLWRTLF